MRDVAFLVAFAPFVAVFLVVTLMLLVETGFTLNQTLDPTLLTEYITSALPWAHGHQVKAITGFVGAIFEAQSGCQAALARTQENQEAATKRISRLLHNERLDPDDLAECVL